MTRAHPDVADEPEGDAGPEMHDGPATNGNEAEDHHIQGDMATPMSSARRPYEDGARTPENPASPSRPDAREAASLQPSREPSPAQADPVPQSVDAADGDMPVVTPKLSRKRPRTHDDYILGPEAEDSAAIQSPAGDLQIRRKRIRH